MSQITTPREAEISMKKNRTEVPVDTVAQLQLLSDRTCCVCRVPRIAMQTHHIDGNPSNHRIENLALLCLECHNNTLIKGGFGRHLNAEVVALYRNQWHENVAMRRSKPHNETKTIPQNSTVEMLQQKLYETDNIQSDKPRRLGASSKNTTLEKLRRTLDETDVIQSGRNRTNRDS